MLAVSFISWWYGRGWQQVAASFKTRIDGVASTFSVAQLSKTLFAPWRRIISYPGEGLSAKFRAWGDNVFSRAVGFVVRLTVLLTALIVMLFVILFTAIELVVWPLLPPAVPVLIIAGLV